MVLWKIEALIGALAGAVFALFPFSCPGQIAAMPQQSYASDVQLQAKRSPVDFLPDGDRSKPSWKHAKSVEFDHDASGQSHYPQLSTRVASVWTETRSEEHTSELQSRLHLVCRLLLEKKTKHCPRPTISWRSRAVPAWAWTPHSAMSSRASPVT